MWGYRFLNNMVQGWQDKPWMKYDDVTPYNYTHREQRGVLDFVGEYHFKRYCGCGKAKTTWGHYKDAKKRKLYWRLHPQFKDWK